MGLFVGEVLIGGGELLGFIVLVPGRRLALPRPPVGGGTRRTCFTIIASVSVPSWR